jgi:hypothetical protein
MRADGWRLHAAAASRTAASNKKAMARGERRLAGIDMGVLLMQVERRSRADLTPGIRRLASQV